MWTATCTGGPSAHRACDDKFSRNAWVWGATPQRPLLDDERTQLDAFVEEHRSALEARDGGLTVEPNATSLPKLPLGQCAASGAGQATPARRPTLYIWPGTASVPVTRPMLAEAAMICLLSGGSEHCVSCHRPRSAGVRATADSAGAKLPCTTRIADRRRLAELRRRRSRPPGTAARPRSDRTRTRPPP